MLGATVAHLIQDKNGFQGIPALVLLCVSGLLLVHHAPTLISISGV
jgi:hypothetical protein